MPGPTEADPSRLVAFIAPLLFGYMFGDVGQGAVLVVAGLAAAGEAIHDKQCDRCHADAGMDPEDEAGATRNVHAGCVGLGQCFRDRRQ